MDDDDVYLAGYLRGHAEALGERHWSRPSRYWSTYWRRDLWEQPRVLDWAPHPAIAVGRNLCETIAADGGWIESPRADWDQQMIAVCQAVGSEPGDPLRFNPVPQYVYRWGDSQAHHSSGCMRSPDDTTWYAKTPVVDPSLTAVRLEPRLDDCTRILYEMLC
jgi:hypothetical protein